MAEYPGNSDRGREQEAPEKRVTGIVKGRKASDIPEKGGLAKFIDRIVKNETGETLEGIFTRGITDILTQGVSTVADMISDTISVKLTGNTTRSGKRRGGSGARVSYRDYYEDDEEDDRGYRKKTKAAGVGNYNDIIFDSRGDAEVVLEKMFEMLDTFEVISVADLYDLAEIKHDYQTNKYGWTDLRGSHVERIRDGYVLALPNATSI